MRGKVKNKRARWNSCFADNDQEPDYENGKGTIISFSNVPVLNEIREKIPFYLGDKTKNLMGEMNLYYDLNKCGIGFHGDNERKIVVCARLGANIPLHYQWFYKGKPIGDRIIAPLNAGDIYIMSDKAVGNDWKERNIPTLRHAAGCEKYLTISC